MVPHQNLRLGHGPNLHFSAIEQDTTLTTTDEIDISLRGRP